MAFLSVNCDEVSLGQVATAFANAAEGTLPNTLSRFSGPRLFSGQDTDTWLESKAMWTTTKTKVINYAC